tara:strand:- start:242 stop:520 length:279 start_codon:yes stop_codon:yes gene_type:complete
MSSLEEKLKSDTTILVNKIRSHPESNSMIEVFNKGPPKDKGYMWGLNEPNYWTEEEKIAINIMHKWVLEKGWESSGYAVMFRSIESKLKTIN